MFTLTSLLLLAGSFTPTPDPALLRARADDDAQARVAVIEAVLDALNENYVFPEVATEMINAVRAKLDAGGYDKVGAGEVLARVLTADLRDVCHDLHLSVRYSLEDTGATGNGPSPADLRREQAERSRRANYGFERVECLPGNIGLLRMSSFSDGPQAFAAASAAMNLLANTDALIVDLRQNGGGSPAMVAYLSTYLFGDEPVHLNSLYEPRRDYTHQWWTLPQVPGARFGGDKPVYVLTSRRTFSAAEEYTYNLKCRDRAVIVGRTTGGGAHPVDRVVVTPHFVVWLPFARAINPITGTNWEGTGVAPDIHVNADQALIFAQLEALTEIMESAVGDEFGEQLMGRRDELERSLD
ncbi:MAG: hypothetical protein ACI8QZ_001325 [Chlamydiales bacterium]|jgi:hypothetical protein